MCRYTTGSPMSPMARPHLPAYMTLMTLSQTTLWPGVGRVLRCRSWLRSKIAVLDLQPPPLLGSAYPYIDRHSNRLTLNLREIDIDGSQHKHQSFTLALCLGESCHPQSMMVAHKLQLRSCSKNGTGTDNAWSTAPPCPSPCRHLSVS